MRKTTWVLTFVAASLLVMAGAATAQPHRGGGPSGIAAVMSPNVRQQGILFIESDDVSASMEPFIRALRAAAGEQLRKLLPGDALARVEFDSGEARLVALTQVREAADISDALRINLGPAKGQKTELSRGLIKAREVATSFARGRRIVLVLGTDAKSDPQDSIAAERQRLAKVSSWWKARTDAVIVMVAPNDSVRSSKPFVDLAQQLGARMVGLEEFGRQAVITREIEAIRPPGPPPPVTLKRSPALTHRFLLPTVAALLAIGLAGVLLRRWQRNVTALSDAAIVEPAVEAGAKAHVLVTAAGATRKVVVDIQHDDADPVVTIGGTGCVVELPGYRGRAPITVTSADGVSGDVRVPDGVTAWIGADRIDSQSGPIHFVGRTALKTAGAHIDIRLALQGAAQ
jgi:hypothetical protein